MKPQLKIGTRGSRLCPGSNPDKTRLSDGTERRAPHTGRIVSSGHYPGFAGTACGSLKRS